MYEDGLAEETDFWRILVLVIQCLKLFTFLNKLKVLGGEFSNVPMQWICTPFWRDVLKHYKKLYYEEISTSDQSRISSQL